MKVIEIKNQVTNEISYRDILLNDNNFYLVVGTPDDTECIKDIFGLKNEALGQCFDNAHDTKIEVYPKNNFCVFNELKFNKQTISIDEFNVFYSSHYIICVSKNPVKVIDMILEKVADKENNLLLNSHNPCNKILYLILDELFKEYFDVLIEFEKMVESFEEQVLKNNLKMFVSQFIGVRRQVLRLVRYVSPLSYMIDIIKLNENCLIDAEMLRFFENLDIKFDKLNSNIVSLKESVAYLREAYEAEVSNQANIIMKIFTIVSAIFLPLTLLTGIFGMNFVYTPWLNKQYGFYELLVLMVIISLLLMFVFKKKKWI